MSAAKRSRFATGLIGFLLLLGAAGGCSTARTDQGAAPAPTRGGFSAEASKHFQPLRTNVVAVLPLEGTVSTFMTKELSNELTDRLVRALEIESSLEVLNLSDPDRVSAASAAATKKAAPIQTKAVQLGQQLGAQAVLCGVVTRYADDEEGTKLGSFRPASVGFKLWLVDTDTKAVLWSATYDREQQSLSDNLLKARETLKHGVGFQSSEQLIVNGFTQAAKTIEELRNEARRL